LPSARASGPLPFPYAATAADALTWLAIKKPPGATGYAIAVVTLITIFISWIAVRTIVLATRGQLFPAWPQAAAPQHLPAANPAT
jgi:hypothetical protein